MTSSGNPLPAVPGDEPRQHRQPRHRGSTLAIRTVFGLLLAAAALLPGQSGAEAPLPQRELIVELRDVADATGTASGWQAGTAQAARDRTPQRLRVHNGHSASMHLALTRPVQTWQALAGVWGALAVPSTQWISAGQAITVQPRWPGGAAPVSVALQVVSGGFEPQVAPGSAEPPQRTEVQLASTVSAPLGAWITLAATGEADAALNVVSTRDASASRRVLQLRVSLAH